MVISFVCPFSVNGRDYGRGAMEGTMERGLWKGLREVYVEMREYVNCSNMLAFDNVNNSFI